MQPALGYYLHITLIQGWIKNSEYTIIPLEQINIYLLATYSNDILITKTKTETKMTDFSFTAYHRVDPEISVSIFHKIQHFRRIQLIINSIQ